MRYLTLAEVVTGIDTVPLAKASRLELKEDEAEVAVDLGLSR